MCCRMLHLAVDGFRLMVKWQLDPGDFPRHLDLEVSEEVFSRLHALSAKTGRSISEIATELLSRSVDPIDEDRQAP